MMQHSSEGQRLPAVQPTNPSAVDLHTTITTAENLKAQASKTPPAVHRTPITSRGVNPRSCHTCRRRKVKCDKQEGGCGNCLKSHAECIYPGPGRAPRRKSAVQKGTTERETELLKRLRRLEGVVEELSGQVEIEAAKTTPDSSKGGDSDNGPNNKGSGNAVRVVGIDQGPRSTKAWAARMVELAGGPPKVDRLENEFGKLVIDEGKSRYVSNAFWARFHGEVENIRELFYEDEPLSEEEEEEESSPEASGPSSTTTDLSDHHSFVMGYSSSNVNLRSLHPLPSQIPFYWETFKENVDPLCKLLHIPTMSKTIKEIKDNLGSLSRSREALCFAIYFATITSMSPEEVKTNFAVEKAFLLKRYRFGTEQALARAGFLQTSEIVTVQAFVLFLVCVRRFDDSKFVWTLTGLIIRIAQSLGLHRDGTRFNLSPFDTEIRRRCWWQICTLDIRASEDYGSDPSILEGSFDTQLPLNINDADLDPKSLEPPEPKVGVTEMTFCLIRYEICHTSRSLSYVPPGEGLYKTTARTRTLAEKEQIVKSLQERLESKYLVHCQDKGPLFWVAATVARLIVAKMGLVIYSPHIAEGLPQSVKNDLFVSSIQIMEYSRLLETETSTKQWGWLFHTYVQWHAIAFILGEVITRPQSEIVERGWRAVDGVFNDWDDAVKHSKNGMLWGPMRKLMAKARMKREADMQALSERVASDYSRSIPPSDALTPAADGEFSVTRHDTLAEAQLADLDPVRPLQKGLPRAGHSDVLSPNTDIDSPIALQEQQQTPSQLQVQYQQMGHMNTAPWILDDSALVDLDMNAISGDVPLEGWDDLVSCFQMEVDSDAPEARGSIYGPYGMGPGSWL